MYRSLGILLAVWAGSVLGASAEQCAPVTERNLTCGVPFDPARGVPVATLTDASGNVMISVDSGFSPIIGESVSVLPGDRVLVTDDGQATLNMGSACYSHLAAPSSVTIVADGDCVYYQTGGATQGQPGDLAGGTATGTATSLAGGGLAGGAIPTAVAVGIGVAAIAGVVAVVAEQQSGNDTPVPISP